MKEVGLFGLQKKRLMWKLCSNIWRSVIEWGNVRVTIRKSIRNLLCKLYSIRLPYWVSKKLDDRALMKVPCIEWDFGITKAGSSNTKILKNLPFYHFYVFIPLPFSSQSLATTIVLSVYKFDYCRYLIWVQEYTICYFMFGLFHLA